MSDFFESIYNVFISLFGDNLSSFLSGACTGFEGGLYNKVGLSTTLITLVSILFYYFYYVNSKRNKYSYYFFIMTLAGFFSGLVAFYLPFSDLQQGLVCPQFTFSTESVVFFGIINLLLSIVLFFVFSLGAKYIGKADGRYMPFKF